MPDYSESRALNRLSLTHKKFRIAEIRALKKANLPVVVHFIPTKIRGAIWYQIEFTVMNEEGTPVECILMTTRNTPYVRQSLDRAMEMIREEFPANTTFTGEVWPNEKGKSKK